MYSLLDYGRMIENAPRMRAYADAIAEAVRPGARVVDLGAGTGICTLLALRAGAAHVTAIDTNPAVKLVPRVCADNGFAPDRVTAILADAQRVELSERADVLLADLRGVVPLYGKNLAIVHDAARRFLKPEGVLVPAEDTLYAALVEAPETYRAATGPFGDRPLDFDMRAVLEATVLAFHHDRKAPIAAASVLSNAEPWATVRYRDAPPDFFQRTLSLVPQRDGLCHGLALWFEARLTAAITLSSAPGNDVVYSRGFLPYFEPFPVTAGAAVGVRLTARATKDDYIWAWTAEGPVSRRHTSFSGL
ncbi:MAG: methyltransferase domain-containing protein [Polyangiaceae bacterium]|nr:methyltransferase domain-containing protein [Polyangiaceae bacterium]